MRRIGNFRSPERRALLARGIYHGVFMSPSISKSLRPRKLVVAILLVRMAAMGLGVILAGCEHIV